MYHLIILVDLENVRTEESTQLLWQLSKGHIYCNTRRIQIYTNLYGRECRWILDTYTYILQLAIRFAAKTKVSVLV